MVSKYAEISNGKVSNIALAAADVAAERGWIQADNARIGDLWDGEAFTTPAPETAAPSVVTMRQARLALLQAGLLSSVESAINAIEDPSTKAAVLIEWEYSMTMDRAHPWVISLSSALNLTESDLDNLFTNAFSL